MTMCLYTPVYVNSRKIDVSNEWPLEIKYFIIIFIFILLLLLLLLLLLSLLLSLLLLLFVVSKE